MFTIKDVAKRIGLHFGSAHDWTLGRMAATPVPHHALFTWHCELYAPSLSWAQVAQMPSPAPYTTDPDIFTLPGMRLTGWHLVWQENVPAWAKVLDGSKLQEAITSHIAYMGAAYGPASYSVNVVNEIIDRREGGQNSLRNNIFYKSLGPTYPDEAFKSARAAFPVSTLLVHNENHLEPDTVDGQNKRDDVVAYLKGYRDRNVPCDALGIQFHHRLDQPFNRAKFRAFLDQVATLKFKILLTEMDVFDPSADSSISQDYAVADRYWLSLTAALGCPAVVALVTWELSDRYTWISPKWNMTRPDGSLARPLPFDAAFQYKPAYWALLAAIATAPMRN